MKLIFKNGVRLSAVEINMVMAQLSQASSVRVLVENGDPIIQINEDDGIEMVFGDPFSVEDL